MNPGSRFFLNFCDFSFSWTMDHALSNLEYFACQGHNSLNFGLIFKILVPRHSSFPRPFFFIWRSLWMFAPELKSRKKNCTFFSLNLFSIPRDIPWHHWKNLLTSKRGCSGGFNFFTKPGQVSLKTSEGSRDLNFNPICKGHTILETSWCPYEALHNLIDLQGH